MSQRQKKHRKNKAFYNLAKQLEIQNILIN